MFHRRSLEFKHKLKADQYLLPNGMLMFAVIAFVYFNFYRFKLRGHIIEFIKRIVAIYFISTLSVILVLFLIDKLPVFKEPVIAFKRVVIIAFPAIFWGNCDGLFKVKLIKCAGQNSQIVTFLSRTSVNDHILNHLISKKKKLLLNLLLIDNLSNLLTGQT
jgi:hypothetical protein